MAGGKDIEKRACANVGNRMFPKTFEPKRSIIPFHAKFVHMP